MADETPRVRAAIVAAEFNADVVGPMIAAAEQELRAGGAEVARTVRVTGCYELPLVVDRLLAAGGVDTLVVLGYIERGETLHGEVMGYVIHDALVRLQMQYRTPIGIGIIGPGATPTQAETRKLEYARNAARAALANLLVLRSLSSS